MRTNWETFPIELKGGLITNVSPLQQGINFPGSATILTNFEPSIEGGYKKVLGYTKWNEFEVPGTGQIQASILTDVDDCITVRDGIYYTSTGKSDWVSKLDLSATPGGKVQWASFNFNGTEKVVMVDGVNKPVIWEAAGGTITEDTLAPADVDLAERVVVFKNHIFFSKGPNLIFTAPFDEKDYSAANGSGIINVGANITGMIVFREQLIVFSEDRIHRIAGNTLADFIMQPITVKTGAINGDSIQEVAGDILYLGPDGVRYLSATERIGDFALARASERIQKDVTDDFTGANIVSSVVVRKKSQYRIFKYVESTSSATARGFLATRYMDQGAEGIAWASLAGFKVYSADSRQFGTQEQIIFCSSTGYIYLMEEGNSFDGANIACAFKTPFMPLTDPRVRKTLYKHTAYMKVGGLLDLTARIILDYEGRGIIQPPAFTLVEDTTSSGSLWGSFLWGGGGWNTILSSVFNYNAVGSGFTFAFDYRDDSTNPSFSMDTILLEFRQNDRK